MTDEEMLLRGFVDKLPDALRYDLQTDDPHEAAGIVLSMIPRGARVLDVGCGTGATTWLIREKRVADVVAIEPNPERARAARARGLSVRNEVLAEGLLSELGSFDIIVLQDVLEHLSAPACMLALCKRALRPRGSVVASIPNVAHWSVRLDLLRGHFDYQPSGIMDATHLRWFTTAGAKRLFDAEGLKIVEHRMSAGSGQPEYVERWPWCWMPARIREPLVHGAVSYWPNLFGCQHIIRAVPTNH
jgi:methionine biosynthesis protein MetW